MSISFPNKQAETLASAIITLARAFAKGREKHSWLSHDRSVVGWCHVISR